MKFLVVLAAGLLVCQAASVSKDVSSSTVSVPHHDLLPPPVEEKPHHDEQKHHHQEEKSHHVEQKPHHIEEKRHHHDEKTHHSEEKPHNVAAVPAVVVEVTKDHVPQVDIPVVVKTQEVVTTTLKSEVETSTPKVAVEEKTTSLPMPTVPVDQHSEAATTVTVTEVKSQDEPTVSSTHNPCDVLCTKFEFEPICATNGLCLHEFANQCILDTYNCKHPSKKFSATKDDRCQMHWLTKCEESDLV